MRNRCADSQFKRSKVKHSVSTVVQSWQCTYHTRAPIAGLSCTHNCTDSEAYLQLFADGESGRVSVGWYPTQLTQQLTAADLLFDIARVYSCMRMCDIEASSFAFHSSRKQPHRSGVHIHASPTMRPLRMVIRECYDWYINNISNSALYEARSQGWGFDRTNRTPTAPPRQLEPGNVAKKITKNVTHQTRLSSSKCIKMHLRPGLCPSSTHWGELTVLTQTP